MYNVILFIKNVLLVRRYTNVNINMAHIISPSIKTLMIVITITQVFPKVGKYIIILLGTLE